MAKIDGCEAMISKWKRLRVKSARALIKEIRVPEFGIQKVQSQPTYMVNGEHPTIFIASDSESPHFTAHMVGHYLAELFQVPSLRSDIALILSAPEHRIDDNFWNFLNVPELPRTWTALLEASAPPYHLNTWQASQINTPRVEASSEVEMSSEEAADIIQFINTLERSSTETFRLSTEDKALVSSISPSLKRLNHLSIIDDEDEVEITRPNIRSGFAGEFFVASFAKFVYNRYFGN
jgi:hypothetical protein